MTRGRQETADALTYSVWLVFDWFGKVRVTKTEPDLNRNERAMYMKVTLPKALFTIPTLRASMTVDNAGAPVIDVKAVADAVKMATGMDIDVQVIPQEDRS